MLARFDDHLTVRSKNALLAANGVFHQFGHIQIAMDRRYAAQADRFQIVGQRLRGVR
jgi:hypothetical protein